MINGNPKSLILYHGREIDCQNALCASFGTLLLETELAGWSEFDSLGALYSLVEEAVHLGDTRSDMEIAAMVNQESITH
jgi:hypothetical protein